MNIRYFAERSQAFAAASGRLAGTDDKAPVNSASQAAQAVQNAQRAAAATEVAPSDQDATPSPAVEATAQQPATLPHFSPAGRLLNALQAFEQRHPDETKQALSNIADKLRADAEHAGVFSDRLAKWADRFQQAAESGDMSSLMPRYQAHFGVRAYQQNQQTPPEADESVAHVAGVAAQHASTPPAAVSGSTDSVIAPITSQATSPVTANDRPSTVAAPVTTIPTASAPTAPQKSTLVDSEGASDMRANQSPPIIVTDRATSVATQ